MINPSRKIKKVPGKQCSGQCIFSETCSLLCHFCKKTPCHVHLQALHIYHPGPRQSWAGTCITPLMFVICVCADVCHGSETALVLSSVVRHWCVLFSQFSPGPVRMEQQGHSWRGEVGTATASRPACWSPTLWKTRDMPAILKQKNPKKIQKGHFVFTWAS